ncbi:SDR family oxidoreductase [Gordonia rubripertincta]|uniref:SDR family oxidoreductase n=1 Tax=Gordonia rubripertincta TaxID=36822 RepID=A0ABT4MZW7_GORRU|nr:SDR family oxidoreductase [Gordonia rubripertincta]MCZ4551257.1 SDR family oxidoreductase [Gordonia rubripertincta]
MANNSLESLSADAFANRTVVMSGGSRGIGLAISIALAERGANIVLLAKTDTPHPKLPGTIHTAVEEIQKTGAKAIGVVGDVRNVEDVQRAVDTAVSDFGGIDIVVHNASVINEAKTADLPLKRYDLMQGVNVRGMFALTQAALPHLIASDDAQILSISPPLNMSPHWLGKFPAYTLSKYGMTVLALGFADEFAQHGIAVNCLWPETTIATAAVKNLQADPDAASHAREPEVMADAAALVLARKATETGECLIDADVLTGHGVSDLSAYGGVEPLDYDFYVDR